MPSQREYMLPLLAVVLPAVRETLAFAPVSPGVSRFSLSAQTSVVASRQRREGGALGMAIDPQDAITHAQTAADLINHGGADHVTSHVESAFTTLNTAVADVVKHAPKREYTWKFLWFHGDSVINGVVVKNNFSIPPGFTNPDAAPPSILDYFLPYDPEKQAEAIRLQNQAASAGASAVGQGIDSSKMLRDALPGGRPEVFFDTPINPSVKQLPMSAEDLDEVAHDADIMSRLPMVAFASVLIDFFFFNSGNDIYRDEIENDDKALRVEWVGQVVPRLGIGIVVALLTIWSSYTFYHPIPGL